MHVHHSCTSVCVVYIFITTSVSLMDFLLTITNQLINYTSHRFGVFVVIATDLYTNKHTLLWWLDYRAGDDPCPLLRPNHVIQ